MGVWKPLFLSQPCFGVDLGVAGVCGYISALPFLSSFTGLAALGSANAIVTIQPQFPPKNTLIQLSEADANALSCRCVLQSSPGCYSALGYSLYCKTGHLRTSLWIYLCQQQTSIDFSGGAELNPHCGNHPCAGLSQCNLRDELLQTLYVLTSLPRAGVSSYTRTFIPTNIY